MYTVVEDATLRRSYDLWKNAANVRELDLFSFDHLAAGLA